MISLFVRLKDSSFLAFYHRSIDALTNFVIHVYS
jgi:hypothetical protein